VNEPMPPTEAPVSLLPEGLILTYTLSYRQILGFRRLFFWASAVFSSVPAMQTSPSSWARFSGCPTPFALQSACCWIVLTGQPFSCIHQLDAGLLLSQSRIVIGAFLPALHICQQSLQAHRSSFFPNDERLCPCAASILLLIDPSSYAGFLSHNINQ
jgi:hypothetical protein